MKMTYLFGAGVLAVMLLAGCSDEEKTEKAASTKTSQEQKKEQSAVSDSSAGDLEETVFPEEELTKESAIEQAKETFNKNIEASINEDVKAYMETIYAADMGSMQAAIETIFEQFDLDYKIGEITVESVSEDFKTVILIVPQTTIDKLGSPSYRNNQITAAHTLKWIEGSYRITNTVITEVKYLD